MKPHYAVFTTPKIIDKFTPYFEADLLCFLEMLCYKPLASNFLKDSFSTSTFHISNPTIRFDKRLSSFLNKVFPKCRSSFLFQIVLQFDILYILLGGFCF
jgi:hypothetical protein